MKNLMRVDEAKEVCKDRIKRKQWGGIAAVTLRDKV